MGSYFTHGVVPPLRVSSGLGSRQFGSGDHLGPDDASGGEWDTQAQTLVPTFRRYTSHYTDTDPRRPSPKCTHPPRPHTNTHSVPVQCLLTYRRTHTLNRPCRFPRRHSDFVRSVPYFPVPRRCYWVGCEGDDSTPPSVGSGPRLVPDSYSDLHRTGEG